MTRIGVWLDYCRAQILQFWGARIGRRVRIGTRCRIDRPWRVTLGERVVVEPDVWMKLVDDSAVLELARHVFVGRGGEFDIREQLSIGENTLIAPGCFITDHAHRFAANTMIAEQGTSASPVAIGRDVWIGAQCSVLAGVKIGDGAVIGANSVVNTDVEPNTIVAGSPARQIGRRGGKC